MVGRGEVWWHSDGTTGRRPYLVLTRDEAIPVVRDVIAIPATTRTRGIPTEVPLDGSDGMPTECVLRVDQVTTVMAAMLTDRITRLSPARMQQVCLALRRATSC